MLVARNSLAQRKATFLHPHTPLLPRHVVKCTSKGLVDGHPSTAAPDAVVSASQGSAAQTQAPERADGFPVTPVTTPLPTSVGANSPYESLDDMAAYVEARRREEDDIRRKREEVELQLLRMRQQEAVRRQQAIKLRLATERANAAVLASAGTASQQPSGDAEGGGSSSPGAAGADGPSPMGGPPGAPASSGAPKKKLMLKKSKRMTAVAAAAGLHRVGSGPGGSAVSSSPPLGSATSARGPLGSSAPRLTGTGAGVGPGPGAKPARPPALLSREDLIAAGAAAGTTGSDSECDLDPVVVPKPVFIVSDCTGESAARTVRAALNQFETRCRTQAPAQIMVFRFVDNVERMVGIIKEAAKEDALVVYTLVDPKMVKAVQTACQLQAVRYVDLWSALLDNMEVHLNAVRLGVPPSLAETRKPTASLNPEYFKMIEAVEYTRKMDDGAHPQNWKEADLLILGVSRCGKTPLSIYLGQRGYKVANLPLIPNCPVPKELHEIDQTRIVGLIIDPHVLASIRRNRVSMMGVARAQGIDYAEVQKINAELEWARKLYNANPDWPVLDVTLRGIEETAARILRLLTDRRGDAVPQWVEAYHMKQAAAAAAAVAAREAAEAVGAAEAAAALGAGVDGASVEQPPQRVVPTYTIPELIYGANESSFLMQGLY